MTASKTIRGYELREQIGRGGFGIVYRAYQPIVDREVAIKVILPQFVKNPDFVRNFETEAQLIARLAHPFVVPLFDYWREPDGAYLVMRFLPGGSWRHLLKHDEPVSPTRLAPMLLQVATALDAAHRAQIIHRDIKPENILLDDEGNTYLADFGIAKKIDPQDQGENNQFRGTLAYTAPEIIQSSKVSPAADIYSLGYTVHEMLAGKHALEKLPAAAILAYQLEVTLPLLEGVPDAINDVIQRATAKDPTARYATAQSMAREFFEALNQSSTTALTSTALNIVGNPYKGLRPFDEADARDFFGREAIVDEILGHLANENFLTVVGPSGSGKSSVVRAGVLPALREGRLPKSDDWFIVTMMPGAQPLQQLKTALLKVAFDPSDTLSGLLERDTGLAEALTNVLDIQSPLLLVIDQFEEVFTLVDDEAERRHFLELLYQAVTTPNTKLKILVTLRADFYDRPLLYENFGALVQAATQVVLPLKTDELQQAIISPAKRVGIVFDSELIAAIVSDVRQEPGALPLLQYALTELFEHREGNRLLLVEYQKSGGVSGALARRAEDVYQELPADQQRLAQQIFLRLVNPGEGTEDTRRRARYSELVAIHPDRKQVQMVLDQFGKYRLLTFDNDIETREPTIEVAHEALIREWQRLRGWLNESRHDLRLQRMLSSLMQEWRAAKQDKSFLLYGTRLAQFEEWSKTSSLASSQDEKIFLEASVVEHQRREAAEAERQARERALERASFRRLQAFVVLLVVASLAGVGLLLKVIDEGRIASRRADEAESARQSARAQQMLGEGDTMQAIKLGLESVDIPNPPVDTVDVLVKIAYGPGVRRRILTGPEAVIALALSPDGKYLLTGSGTSNSANQGAGGGQGQPPQGGGPQGGPPQGGPPAGGGQGQPPQGGPPAGGQGQPPQGGPPAGGGQGQPRQGQGESPGAGGSGVQGQPAAPTLYPLILWDLSTGEEVIRLSETEAMVSDILFLPQTGDMLQAITASKDGHIVLWDVLAGKPLHELQVSPFDKITLSLSQNGKLLITAGSAGEVVDTGLMLILDLATWTEERRVEPVLPRLWTGQISHDGTFAISNYQDGEQVIWDTATGEELRRFIIPSDEIKPNGYISQISPDDQTVVISTGEANTWLWNIADGSLIGRLPSGTVNTQRVLFSADGTELVIASQDGILRLWDIENGIVVRDLRDRGVTVDSIALNERTVVTGTTDGAVYVWDVDPPSVYQLQTFQGQPVKKAEFVPGTNQILTFGSVRNTQGFKTVLSLWDIDTGEAVKVFGEGHAYIPQSLAVSADGHFALTGTVTRAPGLTVMPGIFNEMILWDLTTGEEVRRLSLKDTENTLAIAFNPTDSTQAVAMHDRDVLLWDLEMGEVIRTFGHERPVKGLAYQSDGKTVVSVAEDGLRVWNAETGDLIHFFAIESRPEFLCLTPDGTSALIIASEEHDLSLIDLTSGTEKQHFKGHTDGPLSCDISADGKWGLTGSWDNTFILWDLATGQIIRRYTEHNAAIWDVAFQADQKTMLSVGEGQGVILWRSAPVTLDEAMAWIAQNRYQPTALAE